MIQIIQLDRQDLRSEIRDCLQEYLEDIKKLPTPNIVELPDICDFNEACGIVGYSKSKMYKETSNGTVPFKKYGKRLIFSRQQLAEWMKSRTTNSPREIMATKMAKELRNR